MNDNSIVYIDAYWRHDSGESLLLREAFRFVCELGKLGSRKPEFFLLNSCGKSMNKFDVEEIDYSFFKEKVVQNEYGFKVDF